MFECITNTMLDKYVDRLLKPFSDFMDKLHITCRSRCCFQFFEVGINIFQRGNTKSKIFNL